MADYKVVFRADESSTGDAALLWEPACPAMLTAVQISRNVQTSEAYLQVKVRNVSGVKLESVYGVATVNYADGSSDSVEFEDLDVDLAPGGQKALKAKALPKGDVESAVVKLNQIALQDDKWSSSVEPAAVPDRMPVVLSEKAMTERRRKLEEAGVDPRTYDFAVQDKGDWWVCSCGQVNVGTDGCCECGTVKAVLLNTQDEEVLCESADAWFEDTYAKATTLAQNDKDVESLKKASSLYSRISIYKDSDERKRSVDETIEKLVTASSRRRRRIVITIIVGLLAIISAVLLAINVVIPTIKYNSALSAADNGRYDEAIATLTELGDFNDSEEQIAITKERKNQATYDSAKSLLENGDYEQAYDAFSSISKFSDSKQLAIDAANAAADEAEKNGDTVKAIDWYDKAGNSEGINQVKYNYIKANYNNSDSTTYAYLTELKDSGYSDAPALYADLYRVTARIVINDNRDDTETSLSTIGYKSTMRPVCHVFIDGGYMGDDEITVWALEESTWGTDGVVKRDYSQNGGGRENNIVDFKRGWNTYGFRHTGSNVYDHRLTITSFDTDEVLASAEVHTPYSY